VAALACSAAALALLVAYLLSWRFMGAPAPAVLPPAGEVLDGKAPFRFAVVGDSHSKMDVFEAILGSMKADGVSLVLHAGDMVEECAEVDFDWLLQELEEARIGVPFCAVPGNHDTVEGESDPQARCHLYGRSFGPRQYWFAYANALFVGLDASLKTYGEEDLRWLDRTLSRLRSQFEACFVYTHVPPFDPRESRNHRSESGVNELGRILEKHRVSALFSGHIHSYLETTLEGVPVYISGGGGGDLREPLGPHHYLLCTVEPGGRLRVEKKPVVAASREDYWEHLLLVVWPRRLGVGSVLALMAAGVLFSVLAGLAQRRRRA
jgi:Icc-related predicted phosphoesterase